MSFGSASHRIQPVPINDRAVSAAAGGEAQNAEKIVPHPLGYEIAHTVCAGVEFIHQSSFLILTFRYQTGA